MMLNTRVWATLSKSTGMGVVSLMTAPDAICRPSITSTGIGCAFFTNGMLCFLAKPASRKQEDAPESTRATVAMFLRVSGRVRVSTEAEVDCTATASRGRE